MLNFGRRDVLVVFDYRRYQSDTINSARVAASRGCTVVLVTDPWLSPAAASAKLVLVTGVQTTVAPFDSMVSALAVTENQNLRAALRFASAAAALKCTRFGGAFAAPQRAEVEALLSQGQRADPARTAQ